MLNYLKAEWWKALRRPLLWGVALVLLAGAALFTLILVGADFADLAGAASAMMLVGALAAPLLVQSVDGGTLPTLKNELSFGLGRGRVYLGKLLAGLLLGLALCAAVMGGLLALGWAVLDHGDPEGVAAALGVLGFCLLGALPVWCGALALCHALALSIPSAGGWIALYYISFWIGQPILTAFVQTFTGQAHAALIQAVLMPHALLMPQYLSGFLSWEYQLWCWAIGLGWAAASTALGLCLFARKDLR